VKAMIARWSREMSFTASRRPLLLGALVAALALPTARAAEPEQDPSERVHELIRSNSLSDLGAYAIINALGSRAAETLRRGLNGQAGREDCLAALLVLRRLPGDVDADTAARCVLLTDVTRYQNYVDPYRKPAMLECSLGDLETAFPAVTILLQKDPVVASIAVLEVAARKELPSTFGLSFAKLGPRYREGPEDERTADERIARRHLVDIVVEVVGSSRESWAAAAEAVRWRLERAPESKVLKEALRKLEAKAEAFRKGRGAPPTMQMIRLRRSTPPPGSVSPRSPTPKAKATEEQRPQASRRGLQMAGSGFAAFLLGFAAAALIFRRRRSTVRPGSRF